MPPSGFSNKQARFIINFLKDCSIALEQENKPIGMSPIKAISRECSDIKWSLENKDQGYFEKQILKITEHFYNSILSYSPEDYDDFELAVNKVLEGFENKILSIHIDAV